MTNPLGFAPTFYGYLPFIFLSFFFFFFFFGGGGRLICLKCPAVLELQGIDLLASQIKAGILGTERKRKRMIYNREKEREKRERERETLDKQIDKMEEGKEGKMMG